MPDRLDHAARRPRAIREDDDKPSRQDEDGDIHYAARSWRLIDFPELLRGGTGGAGGRLGPVSCIMRNRIACRRRIFLRFQSGVGGPSARSRSSRSVRFLGGGIKAGLYK